MLFFNLICKINQYSSLVFHTTAFLILTLSWMTIFSKLFCTFFNTFKNYAFEFESVGVDRHHCCPMKKGFKMLPYRSSSSSFSVVLVVQHESACLTAQFGDRSRVQILVVTALWPEDCQGWWINFHLEWVERVLATRGQEDLQKCKKSTPLKSKLPTLFVTQRHITLVLPTYVDVAVVRCPSSRVLGKPLLNSELKNHLRKIA